MLDLLAYCGLYCGACSFKVAFEEDDRQHLLGMPAKYDPYKTMPMGPCPGCRGDSQCGDCAIKDCAMSKQIVHCGECGDYPCDKLHQFNADGIPHHGESIANLNAIREHGTLPWLEDQKQRWTCGCGSRLSWYLSSCPTCQPK